MESLWNCFEIFLSFFGNMNTNVVQNNYYFYMFRIRGIKAF